jgi:hypothetical protein
MRSWRPAQRGVGVGSRGSPRGVGPDSLAHVWTHGHPHVHTWTPTCAHMDTLVARSTHPHLMHLCDVRASPRDTLSCVQVSAPQGEGGMGDDWDGLDDCVPLMVGSPESDSIDEGDAGGFRWEQLGGHSGGARHMEGKRRDCSCCLGVASV